MPHRIFSLEQKKIPNLENTQKQTGDDMVGGAIALAGVGIIMYWPRG